jgi:hypothetical protein
MMTLLTHILPNLFERRFKMTKKLLTPCRTWCQDLTSPYDSGDEDDYTLPDVSSNCCNNDSSINLEESIESNEEEVFNTEEANLLEENYSEIKNDGQKSRSSGFLFDTGASIHAEKNG